MSKRKILTVTAIAAVLLSSAVVSGARVGQSSLVQEGDRLYTVETTALGKTIKQPAGSVWDGFVAESRRAPSLAEMQAGAMIVEGDYAYLVETTSAGHTFKRRVAAVWDGTAPTPGDGTVPGLDYWTKQQQASMQIAERS